MALLVAERCWARPPPCPAVCAACISVFWGVSPSAPCLAWCSALLFRTLLTEFASCVVLNRAVVTKKCRILDVVYNASNNELVRTKTIVKNAIVQIDSTPFRQWYELHYHAKLAGKKAAETAAAAPAEEEKKMSAHLTRKVAARKNDHNLDAKLAEVRLSTRALSSGGVLACVHFCVPHVQRC